MKNFVKENWYKLMIGCSMFIFSISALIYSVAPARAEKPIINNAPNNGPYDFYVVSNGALFGYENRAGNYLSRWDKIGVLK
jgi:hypothetical protein